MDPEKAAKARQNRLKTIFNICSEEYEAVLAYQDGVCPITRKSSTLFHIDHDHKTGLVRGILDWQANKGLSYFNDDPAMLRRAAEYLENPPFTMALGERVFGVMGKVTKKAKRRTYGPDKTSTAHPRSESSLFHRVHGTPKPRVIRIKSKPLTTPAKRANKKV